MQHAETKITLITIHILRYIVLLTPFKKTMQGKSFSFLLKKTESFLKLAFERKHISEIF